MSVVTTHMVCFCDFARSEIFQKNARELGVGRGQFHSDINGLIGIITSECPLLNYFLLIAKPFMWDCRRSQILPSLAGFIR